VRDLLIIRPSRPFWAPVHPMQRAVAPSRGVRARACAPAAMSAGSGARRRAVASAVVPTSGPHHHRGGARRRPRAHKVSSVLPPSHSLVITARRVHRSRPRCLDARGVPVLAANSREEVLLKRIGERRGAKPRQPLVPRGNGPSSLSSRARSTCPLLPQPLRSRARLRRQRSTCPCRPTSWQRGQR
jgi:hypothetical protein